MKLLRFLLRLLRPFRSVVRDAGKKPRSAGLGRARPRGGAIARRRKN